MSAAGGGFLLGLGDGYTRIGIELSPIWLEISKRNGIRAVGEPVASRYWDAYIDQFDVVTMWDVIEHVNYPRQVVARIMQLLKPGGVLLLDTPNRNGLYYRVGELTTTLSNGRYPTLLGIQYSPTPFDHKQIFRVVDMERLLKGNGFVDIEIETRSELSLPIAFYLEKLTGYAAAGRILSVPARAMLALMSPKNKLVATGVKPKK